MWRVSFVYLPFLSYRGSEGDDCPGVHPGALHFDVIQLSLRIVPPSADALDLLAGARQVSGEVELPFVAEYLIAARVGSQTLTGCGA
jgi:hypothetical protein